MAKGRKIKDSADENVEAYRYKTETRKNTNNGISEEI
jgi:hypothetical protein